MVIFFFVYTIVGFLILPPIVKAIAVKKLSSQLHREVSITKLKINPFVLSTTIRGLLIKDPDGQALLSWDEVYVNFQLSSFFGKSWVFKEVITVNPAARVQVNKDLTLNFSDLLVSSDATNTASGPSKPLALRIDRLEIKGAKAGYTDLTPRKPFARVLGPLDVVLTNFRTDPDNKNPYSFSGTTDAGEKFSWSGYFFLSPLRSQGELALENVTLNKYAPLYEDFVRFIVKDGSIDLRSTYDFELSTDHHVASVTNASFALHSLKIAESEDGTNVLELPEFAITGVSADAIARRAEVESVTARDGKIWFQRGTNAQVNIVELSKPSELATNAPGGILLLLHSVTNVVAMLLDSTNQWSGIVHDVSVTGGSVLFEDHINSRPVRLELSDIDVNAKQISNFGGSNVTASISLRWNTNGTVKVDASGTLMPPTADVNVAVEQLELKPLDPYLESKVNVFVLGSKFGVNGKLQLRTPENALPEVSFKGDALLDDFSTVDGVLAEDLLKWDSVRVTGLEANLNPPTVAIKEVAINNATARLVVETNRTINLLAALRMDSTNALPAIDVKPSKRSKKKAETPPVVEASSSTNAPAANLLPKISIANVVFTNSQLRLTDRSLSPAVNLSVQQLEGMIANVSSDELQHADVNLRAKVDDVGPVEITGTVNPMSTNLTTDLKIAVKNVDLMPTSPYSGKFAGYRIAKGKLNMELAYKITDRKLTSKNVITLDQFTFGEKVESPDATKLPVKLAVAVLKDRSGKIELDVPIDGSLDDPQFHLGKVINRAIVNVLTKIVTSPFAVLGSLFGGKSEELNFVEFTPGSSALPPEGKTKLDALAKGLYERPALQLDIEGSVKTEVDREGLRGLALGKQLRQKKWMSLSKSARAETAPDKITLTADEAAQWISTLYRLGLEKGEIQPAVPGALTSSEATNEIAGMTVSPIPTRVGAGEIVKGATVLRPPTKSSPQASTTSEAQKSSKSGEPAELTTADMARALLNAISVSDADLQTLAADRAKVVREYILQTGTEKIEADRVFLVENQSGGVNDKGNRALLQLK